MPVRVEFDLTIMTANQAVQDDPDAEIKRILLKIANSIEQNCADGQIHDFNGNAIGTWSYFIEDDE